MELQSLVRNGTSGYTTVRLRDRTIDPSLEVRRKTSPLPAVPLPPKSSKLPRDVAHASCGNILEIDFLPGQEFPRQERIKRSASMDFLRSGSYPPTKPPLRNDFVLNADSPQFKPNTTTSRPKYTPVHAYEELRDVRDVNQSSDDVIEPAMTTRTTKLSNHQYTRERPQQPMYKEVGSRADSNANPPPRVPIRKCHFIDRRCACTLMSLLIVCIIISSLSVIIVILFGVGVIQPPINPDQANQWRSSMEENIKNAKRQFNSTLTDYKNKLQGLNESIIAAAKNRSEVREDEIVTWLKSAITSLTPEQVADIFGDVTGTLLERCTHEEYEIGVSTSLEVAHTGEYYSDKNYVITGVTCTSTDGYLTSLQSRRVIVDDVTRTHYQCRCVRIEGSAATSNERAECGIHYWQCPTNVG